MAKVNENYAKLPGSYLFAEIARRTAEYTAAHPEAKMIKMGIGDVTRPLAPAVIEAMHAAVDDMASIENFHGYGPEQGYDFLRKAIAENDFRARGVEIDEDEIFVSDGAKSDCGNIGDILSIDNVIAVCDPVYPVYVDTNAMAGRAGEYDEKAQGWTNIIYMPTTAENGFVPALPEKVADVIYLCSPNNPTGTVLNADQLKVWVDYANEHVSIIMFDAAYERFIAEENVPHSIYEIEGAKTCAIEFRSFSKTAGFTGARCGYTVVPKALVRDGESLNAMWNRRQCTKFNGASYIIQRGAAAIYTGEGAKQVEETLDYYRANARVIKEGLERAGFEVYGAVNSPYVWCKAPEGMGSWDLFTKLLEEANVITTPGAGFGPSKAISAFPPSVMPRLPRKALHASKRCLRKRESALLFRKARCIAQRAFVFPGAGTIHVGGGGSCPMCFLLDGQTCRLTRRMNDCASILYRNRESFSFRSVPGGAFAPCYSSSQTSFGFHANNLITCLIGECESNGEVPNGHRKTRPRQTIPVFLLRPYAGYGLGARKRVCGSGKSAGTARARAERAIRCCIWRKRIRRCAIWRC